MEIVRALLSDVYLLLGTVVSALTIVKQVETTKSPRRRQLAPGIFLIAIGYDVFG